jgi:hypothetical protein
MSNGQHQFFGHDTSVGQAVSAGTGAHRQGAAAPRAAAGTPPASLRKRLGIEVAPGDMRGLLPDLAGIAVLVTALGTYGGFW